MGAWGVDTFENDDACDYASLVAHDSDLSRIEATLDRLLATGTEYLEAPQASEALAAADILARLKGQYGQRNGYTEQIDDWVERVKLSPSKSLIDKAQRSLERITTDPSELLELWNESPEFDLWKSSVNALLQRLSIP